MTKSSPPGLMRAIAVAAGRSASDTDCSAPHSFCKEILRLLSIIDGLRADIDSVWNETPDALVMLADWSDVLEAQGRDLQGQLHEAERRSDPVGALGRFGRDFAREAAAAFSKDARIRRLALRGHLLLNAQAAATRLATDSSRRALIERHRATTVRHLERLQGRVASKA